MSMTHLLALVVSSGGDGGGATSPDSTVQLSSIKNIPTSIQKLINDPHIVSDILAFVFSFLFFSAVLLIFLFTVYHAYRWIISQGDKKAIETARNAFWNGIIGLIVVCISFLIINLIGYFFNLNLFHTSLQ